MKSSLLKLFGSHSKPVPAIVQSNFYRHFPGAVNVEWEHKKKEYEAIFYVDEVEHIAHLTEEAILVEFKKNLYPNQLPEAVAKKCSELGEIMNAIVISRQDNLFYEIIVRDSDLKRKLLLFDEAANLLNSGKL